MKAAQHPTIFKVLASVLIIPALAMVWMPGASRAFANNNPISPITPITPPSPNNKAPYIQTYVLKTGKVGKSYEAKVKAYDRNRDDVLTMTMQNLPDGLTMGACESEQKAQRVILTCEIEGTPTTAGTKFVKVTVTDNHGAERNRQIPILVTKKSGHWWSPWNW